MRRVGRRRGDVLRVPLVRDIDAIERIDEDDGDDETRRGVAIVLG